MDRNQIKAVPKYLAAFDFDHTIVDDNTDTVVASLIDRSKIPQSVRDLVDFKGWTAFMQAVFEILRKSDIKPARIKKTVVEISGNVGMVKCLKTLHANNFDIIIISDSNSEFIRDWNDAHDLTGNILQIFTNPAHFDEHGLLIVKPFEHQTECKISAINMCKGRILTNFIARRRDADNVLYDSVFYVGDGANDICPALRLSSEDYACMRKDYCMDKKINKIAAANNLVLKAKTIRWVNGVELLGEILSKIKKRTSVAMGKVTESLPIVKLSLCCVPVAALAFRALFLDYYIVLVNSLPVFTEQFNNSNK